LKPLLLTLTLVFLPYRALAQQPCPEIFKQVPLLPDATSCHIFDHRLPATLSYFVNQPTQMVIDYYLQTLGKAKIQPQPGHRFVLLYQDNKQRLVISPQDHGSQIDIIILSQ